VPDAAPARAAIHVDAAPPDDDPLPPHHEVADLATAVKQLVGDDVRVVAFGELHQRTDRAAGVPSALSRFSQQVVPLFAGRASDLVLETWIPDRACGAQATQASAAVESATARPVTTKSEIATLVDQLHAAKIAAHAMKISCDDWAKVAPPGKELDIEAMLTVITRELGRIAIEAAAAKHGLVLVYGGALHNDLYPNAGVEDWSFAAKVDGATSGGYEEIDLYVPEYAALDGMSQHEPWYPLLAQAGPDHVVVIDRGPRSHIILLPTTGVPPASLK